MFYVTLVECIGKNTFGLNIEKRDCILLLGYLKDRFNSWICLVGNRLARIVRLDTTLPIQTILDQIDII